jgi:hypothetical protein
MFLSELKAQFCKGSRTRALRLFDSYVATTTLVRQSDLRSPARFLRRMASNRACIHWSFTSRGPDAWPPDARGSAGLLIGCVSSFSDRAKPGGVPSRRKGQAPGRAGQDTLAG